MATALHRDVDAAARRWTERASGRPGRGRWLQLARLAVFVAGGLVVVSFTDGLGSLLHVASWWDEPIAFQKFVVWTLLWQLLGLGRGLAPNAVVALPPVAGLSYWLTPGTMRLPALGDRVPLTAGSRRTLLDVVLYAAVLATTAGLLGFAGEAGGRLPTGGIVALLLALAVLGLRDRTPVLAARPEVTVVLLLIFLLPAGDLVYGAKLAVVALWWGTALLATNRHFAFAVAQAVADAPWLRSSRLRRRLWQRDGHDLVPADAVRWLGYGLVGLGFALPVGLLAAGGGLPTVVAVTAAVVLQVGVASALARTGQLELAAFGVLTTVLLFGAHAEVGATSMSSASRVGLLALVGVVLLTVVAVAPERTAPLSPLRHSAGSGPSSVWLFARASDGRFDLAVQADDPDPEATHDRELARYALLPSGRGLDGLLARAVGDPDAYRIRTGEFVAGAALGWAVDGGFDQQRRLLAAIQDRCDFAPGELRVVTLEAHAMQRTELRYRVLDAATGLVEVGLVDPDDMLDRIPWHDPAAPEIPVEVQFSVDGFTGYVSPAAFDHLRDLADAADPVVAPRPAPARAVASPRPRPGRPRPRPAPTAAETVIRARHAAPGEASRGPQPAPRPARHARG